MTLKRSDHSLPGITRRRAGRGWSYRDPSGATITDPELRRRLEQLAIPPAWREVWICAEPDGHLQATGLDSAGRRQYRYHDRWRLERDREKFERVTEVMSGLDRMRATVAERLASGPEPTEPRVKALVLRLLDRGLFRAGGESYAEENDSFGLATLEKRHVSVTGETTTFCYRAKHGVQRTLELTDPAVASLVRALKRRRLGGDDLLAWREPDGSWHDVSSNDVNDAVGELLPGATAKDFRTWHATVLGAVALSVVEPEVVATANGVARAEALMASEVAHYLGNTPAVARASYVDPRVLEAFERGESITLPDPNEEPGSPHDPSAPATHGAVEDAVRDLVS